MCEKDQKSDRLHFFDDPTAPPLFASLDLPWASDILINSIFDGHEKNKNRDLCHV